MRNTKLTMKWKGDELEPDSLKLHEQKKVNQRNEQRRNGVFIEKRHLPRTYYDQLYLLSISSHALMTSST